MKKLSIVFAVLGVLALSYWVTEFVRARSYQARELRRFDRPPASKPTTVRKVRPAIGQVLGIVEISRIRLSAAVIEGAGEQELSLGPGHIPGTAYPGEGGNIGLAGHRDSFFRPLRSIRVGDTVKLTAGGKGFEYRVVALNIVEPDDVSVLYPVKGERLTLVTCYPFTYIGSAPRRFIVSADCVNCG